ncbi:ubiquinol oxidase, mitochondrial [Batrachochytrium salamandrivorans]|nr:ubiquinol oxidase, mitochondrial [Batrachochytrium salamandrivorans]
MLQRLRAVSSSSAKGGESSPATIETPIRHHPQPIRSEFAGPQPVDIATLEKIDAGVGMHRIPISMSDWTAYGIVKFLRIFADLFFQKRYVHRAVVLETVAAVPGMVAGMLRHLTSLRRMRHDGGWISHLLAEAENERLHLLTWMKVCNPSFRKDPGCHGQFVFFNVYFVAYILFPKTAHRMVGYLEEEAVISYTEFLKEIDNGNIENGPAPEIAKDYWNLMDNAKLREVVLAVRADEANHRDMNHHFADRMVIHQEDLKYPVTSDSLKPIVKIVKTEAHKA